MSDPTPTPTPETSPEATGPAAPVVIEPPPLISYACQRGHKFKAPGALVLTFQTGTDQIGTVELCPFCAVNMLNESLFVSRVPTPVAP